MTAVVIPLLPARPASVGTIHIMGDAVTGFTVSHESASGGSWGELHGPYRDPVDAIGKAHALNRDYGGRCALAICPDAGGPLNAA